VGDASQTPKQFAQQVREVMGMAIAAAVVATVAG